MSDSDCARVLRVKSWATIRGHCSNNARLRSNFRPTPNQHVQCRMAYAWPFFTSSSSSQISDVGAEMTSIPPPLRFRYDFVHYRKRAMGAGPDNEPLASPGDFFPD